MKVEVTVSKKPAVRVEVNLVRARRSSCYVPVPVRVAEKPAPAPLPEQEAPAAAEPIPVEDELQPVLSFEGSDSEPPEEEAEAVEEEAEEIDEEDLLALIAEEEAEIAAMYADCPTGGDDARPFADDSADSDYVSELADEVQDVLDDLTSQPEECPDESPLDDGICTTDEAQDVLDDLTSQPEECPDESPLDDGICTTDEAQELVDGQTAAEEDSFDKYGGAAKDDAEQTSEQYTRYLDRAVSGEMVEVQQPCATGQEIICVDKKGKLSRICGVMKNDKSASQSAAESGDEE